MIHTVKGFSVVDETEVRVFLEFPCFLYDPVNSGNLISDSKFLVHIMLKPSMQDFKYDLTSLGDECNFPMVRTFFSTTLLGNQDEDWPFPVLWPLLGLPDLLIIMSFAQNILKNCLKTLEETGMGQPWAQGKPTGKLLPGAVSLDGGAACQSKDRWGRATTHATANPWLTAKWSICETEDPSQKKLLEDPVLRRWCAILVQPSFSILVKIQRFPLEEVLDLSELETRNQH